MIYAAVPSFFLMEDGHSPISWLPLCHDAMFLVKLQYHLPQICLKMIPVIISAKLCIARALSAIKDSVALLRMDSRIYKCATHVTVLVRGSGASKSVGIGLQKKTCFCWSCAPNLECSIGGVQL